MSSAKDIKHVVINLYCKMFGGSPDELEVWDGPHDDYTAWRKEDGLITVIPREAVDLLLSNDKSRRDEGRSRIIKAFHRFVQPVDTAREKDRYSYDNPDFVYVRFHIDKGPDRDRPRALNVIDSSKSGLAMLIIQKDIDLVETLNEGDYILGMSFFGVGARIKGDGKVKHITEITEGKYKGCYILGVEAKDF